jgi:hypothetical protein
VTLVANEIEFKLDNEAVNAALQTALFQSLDAKTKETLVKDALAAITARASGSYGNARDSVVEKAFQRACQNYADQCVADYFEKNDTIKPAIAAICQQAIDMMMAEEYSRLKELAAIALSKTITDKLYG